MGGLFRFATDLAAAFGGAGIPQRIRDHSPLSLIVGTMGAGIVWNTTVRGYDPRRP